MIIFQRNVIFVILLHCIASFPKKSKLVLKNLEALDVEYIFLNHINQLFIFGHCSSISVQNAQKNSEFAEMMIKLKL